MVMDTRARLLIALIFVGFADAAAAGPTVAPLIDHTYVHDLPANADKYIFMSGGPPAAGVFWAGGTIHWRYNDAHRPAAISSASAIAQIQASMAKWHAAGCNVTFVYDGTTANGFSSSDNTNVVGWATGDPAVTAPTTGLTYVAWSGSNFVDADIKINADYAVAYTSGFDATMTHEAGHMLGLNHSDVSGQVMSGPPLTAYNGATTLGSDDIAGCVALYGSTGAPPPGPDVTAPSVPTGLAASSVTQTTLTLTWNASTDPTVGGATTSGVANYRIYVGGTFLGSVTSAGANVSGLAPGTSYSFTVSACDGAGNCSAQSAALVVVTQAGDTQPPTVPTGLVATAVSSTQINLAWNASTDNVGVTGYQVYQGGIMLGTVAGTSASVSQLAPGTAYTFTVSACDAAGNCSAQSAPASANTQAATCSGPKPPDEQQPLACPAGQTGSITQTRTYTCVGTTWTPGAWQTISNTCTGGTAPPPYYTPGNFQDLWWAGVGESGWGLTITQHSNGALFLAWYIYDSSGNPLWVVMPAGQWDAAHKTYTGALYIPSGSSFAAYDTHHFVANASVGTASVRFDSDTTATLTYTVGGISGTKSIVRETFGVANATAITNYADMWWGGASQDGWGLVITQQYHDIFGAWYTYDATGKTTWFVMPTGTWTSSNTYSGALYRTHGAPVLGTTFSASSVLATPAGTLTITFTDANNATMTYTVDGVTQTKPITRLPF